MHHGLLRGFVASVAVAAVVGFVVVVGAGPARSASKHGSVTGTVVVKVKGVTKRDRGKVVVFLEDVPGAPAKQPNVAIRQRAKQFEPSLTIVVRGTTVDFPNEDKIFHNVFSVSRAARFDLGLYKSGSMKSVEMKRPGTIDVYCNIHPGMVAKVKVLDNAYYTLTDAEGRFSIDDVPPGEYPIVAWLPTGDEARGRVTVTASGAADVRLEVTEVTKRATHTRKDGTPYGRYK